MPQCPRDIPIIVFRFEGKNNKSKELRVRKQKVLDALKWLTGKNENGEPNNVLYNDVIIDYDRLDQLPSDDYLQCWSEIIETNAKNGVVFDATSNEQPI